MKLTILPLPFPWARESSVGMNIPSRGKPDNGAVARHCLEFIRPMSIFFPYSRATCVCFFYFMEHYELFFIIPAKYTSEELEPIYKGIRDSIGEFDGVLTYEQMVRKQRLAYPIRKVGVGYYVVFEFDMDTQYLAKLYHTLNMNPDILRCLVVTRKKRTAEEINKEQMIYEKISKDETRPRHDDRMKETSELKGLEIPELKKEETPSQAVVEQKLSQPVLETQVVSSEPVKEEALESKTEKSGVKKPAKVSLEELDKKLDEILDEDIL
jgi:ribosomal protein S6